MQKRAGQTLFSATDLIAFLDCEHRTAIDLRALDDQDLLAERCEADESTQLIAQKGNEHERHYLDRLVAQGLRVVDVTEGGGTNEDKINRTLRAMEDGAEVIFQATLADGPWIGHADFLRRVEGRPSRWGDWSYEVADTKLARSAKAKFLIQLSLYSDLLTLAQGVAPERMHVVLGTQEEQSFRVADHLHYVTRLKQRFLEAVSGFTSGGRGEPYPVPCEPCSMCHWRQRCEGRRLVDDHLSQVAGISRAQVLRLEQAGVPTMAALAALPADATVPRIQPESLARLREQAELQHHAKQTGERVFRLLPTSVDPPRGFARLPAPNPGDLYFDMEGDPLEPGGLEYLFGLWLREEDGWTFRAFWAHDRAGERVAFEQFMDFVSAHRRRWPRSHIYHYAAYEATALKRLASSHATREVELDDLLRSQVLVDLYRVVREALRLSEDSYSIKSVEHFYRPARQGGVQNAGASIVYYERWRDTRDPALLDDIAAYNRDDVESTWQLHEWLLGLRPTGLAWRTAGADEGGASASEVIKSQAVLAIEQRLAAYRTRMVDPLPADRLRWTTRHHVLELCHQLLDFHRRADKPALWELYARMEKDEEELIEDPECLAGLRRDPANPPVADGKMLIHTYLAPLQETKVASGDVCTRCDTAASVGKISFDEATRRVVLRVNKDKSMPEVLHLGPSGPIVNKGIVEALYRVADSLLAEDGAFPAIEQFLARRPPRLVGRPEGQPIVDPGEDLVQASIRAALSLDHSWLYVQGPPGAGKTYTGSRMIVALIAKGKRVGVMSNSHKAINHLMSGAMAEARRQGVPLHAVKKASHGNPDSDLYDLNTPVENVYKNDDAWGAGAPLTGGTAWLFCDGGGEEGPLDYLFVDEAGQVALANLLAAATSAHNLVLLGDQMQLSQPVQGVHPGRSGDSALDYLLDGAATIPPERGIFLATTWRMHPEVCHFISEAVYEGRLQPEAHNVRRTLVLGPGAHPDLRSAGIVHVPMDHEGCSQSSEAEARRVQEIYQSALQQHYTDKDGVRHPMAPENILVVAPYNAQVNLLRRTLPEGARVGTVDKFQGQEAELVIVSMTTSSEHDLPRHIEFLYSRNRLNVAVSRAKCLSVVLANPALMAIRCRTVEQMGLVNTLCWLAEVGR